MYCGTSDVILIIICTILAVLHICKYVASYALEVLIKEEKGTQNNI